MISYKWTGKFSEREVGVQNVQVSFPQKGAMSEAAAGVTAEADEQPKLLTRLSADELRETRDSLRRSVRRPSETDLPELLSNTPNATKNRFQRRELSITHSGWLTKHSRGGLNNWNKRWFLLIGGSLYYSRQVAAPSSSDLHVFAELLHARG